MTIDRKEPKHTPDKPIYKAGAFRGRCNNKNGKHIDWKNTKPQQVLELRKDEKSNALTTSNKDNLVVDLKWRRLSPLEFERLQNIPDNYTNCVSDTKRCKLIANGWTVEVIKHIFKNIKKEKLNVLSLFDGISCGQIALDQLGFDIENYYASEIDEHAIQVTQENYPKTIQVGDIRNLTANEFKDINLIIFGSPCQSLSFMGKQLAFDDPRGRLFFEAVRLVKAIRPKYFLAENVQMRDECLEVFTRELSNCYEREDVDAFLIPY
jgi:site-specific DNA-cytosine methylase